MSIRGGLPFDSTSSGVKASFICSSCHYLLVEPKFSACGHRYCSFCLKKILTSDQSTVCTENACDQIIRNDRIYPDLAIENELKNLTGLICHNKSNGCSWQGDYVSYKDHLQECTFEHQQCEFCLISFTNRVLFQQHDQHCPKALVLCPLNKFGCDVQIRREALSDHVLSSSVQHLHLLANILSSHQNQSTNIRPSSSSSLPSLSNENANIYFLQNELIKRDQLIEQLRLEQKSLQSILIKNEQDLTRTRVDLQLNKGELCQLRKEFELSRTYINNDGTYLWRIDNIQQLFHKAKNSSQSSFIISPPFFTSKSGYKLSLKLYLNGDKSVRNTHLSLYITVMRGEYDSLLNWPFHYPVTLCLYDRSSKHDHVVHTITPDTASECFRQPRMEENKSGGIPQFCPLCKVFDKEFGYVNDNTMFIKSFVDFNIYPTKIWPYWTKIQSDGLPIDAEHIKLKEFLNNQK